MDAGSEPTTGPITLTDTLPAGVSAHRVVLLLVTSGNALKPGFSLPGGETEAISVGYQCTASGQTVRCTTSQVLAPGDWLLLRVFVTVNTGTAGPLTNTATVSGGGAPGVSTAQSNPIGPEAAPFGPSSFSFYKDALDGREETQAGGHPYELTTTIDLNNAITNELGDGPGKQQGLPESVEKVKDIVVDLPLGFAGSTLAAPQCAEAQLDSVAHCPADTVVGHLTTEPVAGPFAATTINSPIWNIVPDRGHPAEFGYIDLTQTTHIAGFVSVVPTPAGYVLQFVAADIPEVALNRIVVTFYGNPAAEQAETRQQQTEQEVGHAVPRETPDVQVPFFTNPTSCSNGPQVAKLWIDSWHNPASFQPGGLIPTNLKEPQWKEATSESPPVTGCDALSFTPELGILPTTHAADSPSGLEFETKLPQTETVGTNATPALKNLTVTFPEGMTVDPSSADGLGVCSNAQIGWEGPTLFDFSQAPPECPESSKIGTLELETPLIPGKLQGEVFLAAQNENPFKSTFAIYVVVNDPITGVVLKIAGELKANPSTGRLTGVFDENPQLPFSSLKVHFFGGPRASLATPPSCGIYTTNSVMEPWSAPDSGPSGTPFSNYLIDENCATGFNPGFTGGATNLQAGAYTTFQASFERQDSDQELAGAEVTLPPGLLANIADVTECGESELKAEAADAPTGGCPASSQVGTVEAGAGPGPNPLFVPGKVFWTGPYNGGPFGLAVVVSANPGPFHFGNVLVRQSIRINPFNVAVTDVSDPFPRYLDPVAPDGQTTGIPIKLRRVDIEIGGVGGKPFTFNPTSCAKETFKVGGQITSTQGAAKTLATPFQVTNCRVLKFTPKFSASTLAKTSRADGASLSVKVAEPNEPEGSQSWISSVKVELPKALPSRLKTLQKACPAKQFEVNPAACPSASMIGHAKVTSPVLPVPLEGPAIFVSHGGEAFPSLEFVLQGDGVKVILVGSTLISKSGITSATFNKTIDDAPFSTFELVMPEGPYSALAALGDLCRQKLVMPTELVAFDGAEIHEATKVSVGGCPRKARKSSKRKAAHGRHRTKASGGRKKR